MRSVMMFSRKLYTGNAPSILRMGNLWRCMHPLQYFSEDCTMSPSFLLDIKFYVCPPLYFRTYSHLSSVFLKTRVNAHASAKFSFNMANWIEEQRKIQIYGIDTEN